MTSKELTGVWLLTLMYPIHVMDEGRLLTCCVLAQLTFVRLFLLMDHFLMDLH